MHIAVLMGGISRERGISLLSGEGVARALEERGHRVERIVVEDEAIAPLAPLAGRIDAALLALHGRFGEDGGVQRRCEALGIPYTGSGPEASALALDKDAAKRRFLAASVPTPAWRVLARPFDPAAASRALVEIGLPCVLKPVDEGSSIGVAILRRAGDLAPALAAIDVMGAPALLEAFLPGREFTAGILGPDALPPIELLPRRAFYDYEAKYDAASGTEYAVDPPLEAPLRAALLANALAAHRALGCAGCSRVDLRLDALGRPHVLEVNTIPGMTARSLLPKAAAAAGISYGELCERLVADGIARFRAGRPSGAAA